MKAIICDAYGPPSELKYQDVPDPTLQFNEVLIQTKACSVNFPDTLIIRGMYQFKPEFPFSPGSDIAGVVEEVGESVKHIKPGDEMIAIMPHGGFAEKVAVDANRCIPKPSGMTMEMAASFLYTYSTSLYALQNRGKLQAGETLLVLGASGGIGLTAVELGKLMGAKVIAAASSDEKLAVCKEYGADELINYNSEDLKARLKELTEGKGVDVILDPVGGQYAEPSLRAIAWEGRYLVVGFAAGEIPKFPLNLALLKSCQIVGVFLGAFTMKFPKEAQKLMHQLMTMFSEGKLKPYIYKTFPLEKAPEAIQMMMDRKAIGKLVVSINS